MKKNIIFDIGSVLVLWEPDAVYKTYFNNDEKALQRFYAETGIFLANREMDRGKAFAEILAEMSARFPHYHEAISYWRDKWEDMIVGTIDASVAVLKNLHKQGYALFALTNWSAETFPIVKAKYDFFNCFRDIVVSGEVKCIKPEPQIYQILLQKHLLKARECIFIDDNSDNVQAAIMLGMNGIVFENPNQLVKDLKKHSVLAGSF
jgi:2-haloacid dehalogenase